MKAPDEILRENAQTYKDKNSDYGDSWRLVGKTLSMWLEHSGVDELTLLADEGTWNSIGLFTRRLDKMIRSFNAQFVVDELNFESTADAHEDESTYAAMHASLIRENEAVEYENDDQLDAVKLFQNHRLTGAEPAQQPEDAPRDVNDDPIFDEPEVPVSIGYRGEARALHETGLDDVQIENVLSGNTELAYELEYNRQRAGAT